MFVRLPSPKILAMALAGLVGAYLLFGWLALPGILQSQAERFVAESAGHRLSLDRPEFNPFDLSLRIANLRLAEPDGKPLFGFKELKLDLSAASIYRRAWVFDGIRLEEPEATAILHPDGRLNWSPLIDALKGKDGTPDSGLPRLDIQSLTLAGGNIDFNDQRAAFATRIQPLDLALTDISTLPGDQGRYEISARTAIGARVRWQGEVTLSPMAATGTLGIENLDLARLAPYFRNALKIAPPSGSAAVSTRYRLAYAAGRLDLGLDNMTAALSGVRLKTGAPIVAEIAVELVEARDGRFDLATNTFAVGTVNFKSCRVDLPRPAGDPLKLLQLDSLALEDTQVDLAGKRVSIGRIAGKGGRIRAVRDARGRVDVFAAWQAGAQPAATVKPAKPAGGAGWRYRTDKLELSGFSASIRDESVAPAADLALEDVALAVDGINENLAAPWSLRASFRARDGGSFEAAGKLIPAEPSVDLKFKLVDLALKPAQPYLTALARLTLAGGSLAAEGRATYDKRGGGFKGSLAIRDLRLDESETGERFLAWKALASRDVEATAAKLEIPEVTLHGLDTKLIIHKDKSLNVVGILRKTAADAGIPTALQGAGASSPTEKRPSPFVVNIDRLRVSNGEIDFADLSLALPFGTRVHRLRGAVIGLSSRPGAPGQVELEGQVDDYGLARAVGQIDLFNPTGFTDLKVIFRNVEMTRLTPYAATFAGRKIDSGKLSLDLEYKIKKRQLAGENQIVMDRLTLGERVDSAEARSLPLDLAIALLEDADGRIDLGLPVSGSLDDPEFSYGGLIWKAVVNVIGKIASAPFRALGALFGGGEKFESIAFETGEAQLTPPEREKLARLAGALKQRPGLSLTLHGVYAEADRLVLQERQLRRAVAERSGQRLESGEHPGPLSTRTPKIQAALESLFSERIGGGELAALKEGFRKANPGQMEQGVAGRMMSRLSGLMRQERSLSEQEVAGLKGADFHATLFDRLREQEMVGETQLLALAKARGENAATGLKAAGAPAERVILALPEKVATPARDVPLKLVLGASPKPAAPAPTPQ